MNNISAHITYKEAVYSFKASQMGLINVPNDEQLANMKLVAEMCFEPIRLWYNRPLKINSFFRSPEVNKAVNGSPTSDHMKGCSIDFTAVSPEENLKIFNFIKENIIYDQVIAEGCEGNGCEWIHISYRKGMNRNQALKMKKINGVTTYYK
ncbi:MAG: D-Ala-D-Ala carboxypeptidase family metallohydrolase [Candidatus Pacearchaeota archaeon]